MRMTVVAISGLEPVNWSGKVTQRCYRGTPSLLRFFLIQSIIVTRNRNRVFHGNRGRRPLLRRQRTGQCTRSSPGRPTTKGLIGSYPVLWTGGYGSPLVGRIESATTGQTCKGLRPSYDESPLISNGSSRKDTTRRCPLWKENGVMSTKILRQNGEAPRAVRYPRYGPDHAGNVNNSTWSRVVRGRSQVPRLQTKLSYYLITAGVDY